MPGSLPALLKAYRVQEKVGRYGFDWDDIKDVFEKLKEECSELETALKNKDDKDKLEDEFGDLIFALVNLGRHLDIRAEDALNGTVSKFMKRFNYIEERLRERGRSVAESDLDEMDRLWEESKTKISP